MRICDWESLALPKQSPRCGEKCLAEYDGRHSHSSQRWSPVVKGFYAPGQAARIECLKIIGSFPISIKPVSEPEYRFADLVDRKSSRFRFVTNSRWVCGLQSGASSAASKLSD